MAETDNSLQALQLDTRTVMQCSATQVVTQTEQSKALQSNAPKRQLRGSTCAQVVKHEPQAVNRGNNHWLVIRPL